MSQSRAQQLGALLWELICCEVQASEGLVDLEGGGEMGPLLGGGRTSHQPAREMGTSHS